MDTYAFTVSPLSFSSRGAFRLQLFWVFFLDCCFPWEVMGRLLDLIPAAFRYTPWMGRQPIAGPYLSSWGGLFLGSNLKVSWHLLLPAQLSTMCTAGLQPRALCFSAQSPTERFPRYLYVNYSTNQCVLSSLQCLLLLFFFCFFSPNKECVVI